MSAPSDVLEEDMKRLFAKMFATAMVAFLLCGALIPTQALSNENIVQIESKRRRGGQGEKTYSMVTISWNSMGGSEVHDWQLRNDKPIMKLPRPTRDGYRFIGWYSAETGGNRLYANSIIEESCTYYARWTSSPRMVSTQAR